MTPEEAIELLKGMQNEKVDYAELVRAPAFAYGYKYVYPEPEDYAIEEAIEALKEVQQYREIGTVEECRELASIINMTERNELAKVIDEWLKYSKIGTVEECQEAVEKQKPKKIQYDNNIYNDGFTRYRIGKCPICGEWYNDRDEYNYCHKCGNKLNWSNENEQNE